MYPRHILISCVSLLVLQPLIATATSGFNNLASFAELLGNRNDPPLLNAESAYRFTAEVIAPDRLHLTWLIAPGTFLYRDKLRLKLENSPEVQLGVWVLPAGTLKQNVARPDGSLGDLEIYQDTLDLMLPLLRDTGNSSQLTLIAQFQGCAERGICYPPITQTVKLALPALAANTASTPPAPLVINSPPEQDRIAATLHQHNAGFIMASFLGFGLLLAFTPCVFPMIPILSGLIAGQGQSITQHRAFILSSVYILTMAFTYAVTGVIAGLFGQNLQATFQQPWLLTSFALLFIALALSLFGFYPLQLPAILQTRVSAMSNQQRSGSFIGVAIMGLLSALMVGPCVAPPLAGALIYIGQTGNALLGGGALFCLGLGMGFPLLIIGTSAGRWLPRAGAWMHSINQVFGVLFLGIALLLLERLLPASFMLFAWGSLLICSAMYLGALRAVSKEASGWLKFWQGVGVVLLLYGALMLVGAAAGSGNIWQPLRGLTLNGSAPAQPLAFIPIKTVADLERELTRARGKPIVLDVYADWCVSCKELEHETFADPQVRQQLMQLVRLRADITHNDAEDHALLHGRFGLAGPPALLLFGADGQERADLRSVGFIAAAPLIERLQALR